MKDLQKIIEQSINEMETLKNDNPNGWVVESQYHVRVGIENGLNDTSFTVKSPPADIKAIIYDTKADAEKLGFYYYLIDGANKPIYMKATKATEFFQREIDGAKDLLIFCQQ